MRLIIKSEDSEHYRSHGFGALMNKALRLCWLHFEKYGNWDVEFKDYQLEDLFPNSILPNIQFYTKDLIWDGDGPKDIDKNRMAFENCFKKRIKNPVPRQVLNWIGVHARGTDKATECELVTIKTICRYIDQHKGKIFLATEDPARFAALKQIYGTRIHSYSGSGTKTTSHHVAGSQRLHINRLAFFDAQALSISKVFLACNSNLSELAMAMRHPELPVIIMTN